MRLKEGPIDKNIFKGSNQGFIGIISKGLQLEFQEYIWKDKI